MNEFTQNLAVFMPQSQQLPLLAPRGFVAELLSDLETIAAANGQFTVAAHCLCRVR